MAEIPIRFEFEDESFKKMAAQMEALYKDAQKFQKAVSGGNNVSQNNQQLKATVVTMEKLTAKMQAYQQEASRAGKTIHGMQSQMKALKIQAQLATDPRKARQYTSEMQKLNKQITKAKNTTGTWTKALGSFQFKFNALGNIAANVASSITNNITRAIRGAIDSVVDFEKSFAEVLTLLNKGDKARFTNLLKGNSVAIMRKYGLTIQDANKAMFDAISAGVKAADVFSVLDAAAKLAVGGVTDLNSAVKGVASVMNAFSLQTSEAESVASAFFQAQKFGITYIDDMVASMGRANTIASLSGASYREMLSAFTAITKSGLNTEEAITGLRNIFKELVSPSKEAADKLHELGIAYGAQAVQSRGFIGVLDDLNEAYMENNEIIPEIFGNIRGLTGIMGIVGKRYKEFRFVLEQVNDAMASNESLNDAVSVQMDTLSKKIDTLKASWQTLFIAIEDGGGQTGSLFKDLLDGVNQLILAITPDYFERYTEAMSVASKKSSSIIRGWKKEIKELGLTEEEERATLIRVLEDETNVRNETYKKSQDIYIKELGLLNNARTKEIELRQELAKVEPDSFRAQQLIDEIDLVRKDITLLEKSVDIKDVIAKKDKAIYEGVLNGLTDIVEAKTNADEEDKKLSEEELERARKLKVQKLKLELDILQEAFAFNEETRRKEFVLARKAYEYELELIKLSQDADEVKKQQMILAELEYWKKIKEIRDKYGKPIRTIAPRLDTSIEPRPEAPQTSPTGDRSPLAEALGLTDDDLDALKMAADEAIDIIEQITDAIIEAAERRTEAIQREIDMSSQRIDELQRDRDLEWQRMQEGYANNFDLAQQELQDEKKRREELRKEEQKSLEQEKRAANIKIAIDTALQLSNLALAAAQLYASEASKGIVGVALATAGLATIIGAFVSFKANARRAAAFADGVIDLNGDGTEKSDSINARLSKGESVMTAKTTRANKNNLTLMQKNPTHPLFSLAEKEGADNVLNSLVNNMDEGWAVINQRESKWDELLYQEIKEHNEFIKKRPYSYRKGNKIITIEGNEIDIYKK